ncbi:unnamed protein product [Calypogeia fissa]
MSVDVIQLVTPEKRRAFFDEPAPQNGGTLVVARNGAVTALGKVLLQELDQAREAEVLARSKLIPLRSEHEKLKKQNEALAAQVEDVRSRLQGTQLEFQQLEKEKSKIRAAAAELLEKHKELIKSQEELTKKCQDNSVAWNGALEKFKTTREREISMAKVKEDAQRSMFESEKAELIGRAKNVYQEVVWWKAKYKAAKLIDDTSTTQLGDEEEIMAMKEVAQLKIQIQQLKEENYHAFNKMLEVCPPEDDERDMVLVDKIVYDLTLDKYHQCESELQSLTALVSSLMDDNELMTARDDKRNKVVIDTGFAVRDIWQNLPSILDRDTEDIIAQEHQIGQFLLRILCCLQGVNPSKIKMEDLAHLRNYIPDRCKPMLPEFHSWGQVVFDDVDGVYSRLLGMANSRAASILLVSVGPSN